MSCAVALVIYAFFTLWRTESLRHSLKLVPPPFHKGGLVCAKLLDGFSTYPSAEISRVVCRAVPWCRRYKQHGFNKTAGASPRPTTKWGRLSFLCRRGFNVLETNDSSSVSLTAATFSHRRRLGWVRRFQMDFFMNPTPASGPPPFHKGGSVCANIARKFLCLITN